MGRHTFLKILFFTIGAVIVGVFFVPGKQGPQLVHLPWQAQQTANGGLQVFGLELGKTSLGEAELLLAEPVVVSLFGTDSGDKVIEGYFDSVDISGLRARIVVVMALSEEEVSAIHGRGERVANIGGGRHKVTLSDNDLALVKSRPIASLTYIPKINLDAELIQGRFGQPAERIKEPEGTIEHWLYPKMGLDISLDSEGKEVLQYVMPRDFEQLRQPLLSMEATGKSRGLK